jgi:hypothetical protein
MQEFNKLDPEHIAAKNEECRQLDLQRLRNIATSASIRAIHSIGRWPSRP